MELLLTGTIYTPKLDVDSIQTLGDVLAPDGVVYPKNGVTLYYGFVSATQSLANAFKYAIDNKTKVYSVTAAFEITETDFTCGLAELPNRKVIAVDRLKSSLASFLRKQWKTLILEVEGAWADSIKQGLIDSNGEFRTNGLTNSIAMNPYLLEKLWLLPEFNHLNVIIYSVIENGQGSNRATVFRTSALKFDEYNVIPEIKIIMHEDVEVEFGNHLPV